MALRHLIYYSLKLGGGGDAPLYQSGSGADPETWGGGGHGIRKLHIHVYH